MPATYAIYKNMYGDVGGDTAFVVITDGATTELAFPEDASADEIDETLRAIGARIQARPENDFSDLEDFLSSLTYNMPLDISVSEPVETYEEAKDKASNFLFAVDGFNSDGDYETYKPKYPRVENTDNEQ